MSFIGSFIGKTVSFVRKPSLVLYWFCAVASAQSVTTLVNQPPNGAGLPFQLTDGTVMVQGNGASDWYQLTPDSTGSYAAGTWKQLSSIPAEWDYAPFAFASAVLADGRVLVIGGEYNHGDFVLSNLGALYDPVRNAWTPLPPPPSWVYIGDSPSLVLPDGRFLIGQKLTENVAALDPVTLQWTELGTAGKADFNSEEGWTLLPDGSVLTVDVKNAPHSERYVVSAGQWLSEGNTPVDLHSPTESAPIRYGPGLIYDPPGEVGPAILRPDGTVYATGASNTLQGHSAIYRPGASTTDPGTWTVGPDFPNDEAEDSSAVLLPSGNVLVLGNSGTLYEFDGTDLRPGPVLDDGSNHNLMLLPTGETLITGSSVQIYTASGTYSPSWAPSITGFTQTVLRGRTYQISGTQFNGLSQAAAFGDEDETATNYPLVRITNQASGHVFYARTHDHSSMGVATGGAIITTNFDIPADAETGNSTLEVVANGIPSPPVIITIDCLTREVDQLGRFPIRSRCPVYPSFGPRQ